MENYYVKRTPQSTRILPHWRVKTKLMYNLIGGVIGIGLGLTALLSPKVDSFLENKVPVYAEHKIEKQKEGEESKALNYIGLTSILLGANGIRKYAKHRNDERPSSAFMATFG